MIGFDRIKHIKNNMAQKRMFSKQITTSDAFMEMPASSQLLYFHLNMEADDDGFVANPKRILRTVGSSEDDLKILLAKRFILGFPSGVVVIKHWLIHNTLRMDRYVETGYTEEKKLLKVKENKAYTEVGNHLATTRQPSIDKISIEEIRIDKNNNKDYSKEFLNFYTLYPRKIGKLGAYKKWETTIKKVDPEKIINGLKAQLEADMFSKDEKFIKHPEVWLNKGCWDDEIIKKENKEIKTIKKY